MKYLGINGKINYTPEKINYPRKKYIIHVVLAAFRLLYLRNMQLLAKSIQYTFLYVT